MIKKGNKKNKTSEFLFECIDYGQEYTTYSQWVEHYAPAYLDAYEAPRDHGVTDTLPYELVTVALHALSGYNGSNFKKELALLYNKELNIAVLCNACAVRLYGSGCERKHWPDNDERNSQ